MKFSPCVAWVRNQPRTNPPIYLCPSLYLKNNSSTDYSLRGLCNINTADQFYAKSTYRLYRPRTWLRKISGHIIYPETHADNLNHFTALDGAVAIDVVHLVGPFQLLLGSTPRCDVYGQEELLEVNLARVVLVECPENVGAKLFGVSVWEESGIHFDELFLTQLARRAIPLKGIESNNLNHSDAHFVNIVRVELRWPIFIEQGDLNLSLLFGVQFGLLNQ